MATPHPPKKPVRPPFPAQHQEQPGIEAALEPRPRDQAPYLTGLALSVTIGG